MQIRFHLLGIDPSNADELRSMCKDYFAGRRDDQTDTVKLQRLGADPTDRVDSLVHDLVKQEVAERLGQQSIAIVTGQTERFQFGITPPDENSEPVIANVRCNVNLIQRSDRLQLELACQPVSGEQALDMLKWTSTINVNSQELITIQPKRNPSILIFAKAERLSGFLALAPHPQTVQQVRHVESSGKMSPILNKSIEISDVLESIPNNTVENIELNKNEFEIETFLGEGGSIREIGKALASLENANIEKMRISMKGSGVQLFIIGRLLGDQPAGPASSDDGLQSLQREIRALREEIQELKLDLTE